MKKILFVYHVSSIGGGSYCLLNILKAIDRQNFKPIVLLSNEGPLSVEIRKLNIEVYTLSTIKIVPYNTSIFKYSSIIGLMSIIQSMGKYKRLLEKLKPDLVYINTMMLYPYLIPAKQKGIKTMIHIREHWPKNEHILQRKIAIDRIKNYADIIVGINKYSASMFEMANEKVVIIYDWIDFTDRYEPLCMNKLFEEDVTDCKIFLYTGGMQRIKGAYEVVKTFSEEKKGENYRLLFLGYDINKPLYGFIGYLKQILFFLKFDINELKVRSVIAKDRRIKCLPSTYKIVDLIQQSYCCISYYTIPHANLALTESLILGTPVIAARTEEVDEYAGTGFNSFFYEINNIQNFKEIVRNIEMYVSTDEKEQSVNSAKLTELFSKKNNVQKLNAVIYNLLYDNFIIS